MGGSRIRRDRGKHKRLERFTHVLCTPRRRRPPYQPDAPVLKWRFPSSAPKGRNRTGATSKRAGEGIASSASLRRRRRPSLARRVSVIVARAQPEREPL